VAGLLHSLLKESAARAPAAPAVRFKEQSLTYRGLDEASDRLAACLVRRGTAPGGRIGLYIDKTLESVVGVFGILKSGSCYVPLDPGSPPERLAAIVNDCGLQRLVVGRNKLPRLKRVLHDLKSLAELYLLDAPPGPEDALPGIALVGLDEIRAASADLPGRAGAVAESDLAYILYTSGSTGRPKGVMISHRASRAFVDWACESTKLDGRDVVSSHAPFHFDLSVFDLYATVEAGAAICLVPQGVSSFPSSLASFIERERITVWYSVPTVLTQLLLHGELGRRDLSSLRTVIFAGEVFPTKYLRDLMRTIPHAEYLNYFGPTETNVCTYYRIGRPPVSDDPIPIGLPCTGQEIAILDEDGKPVGKGERGELYVHGPTLMDGYWGDAEKTARSFRDVPMGNGRIRRAYKTGDLVSLGDDGNLLYHGRSDHMIKSRGYRIELGEIESALAAHPDVREAVVVGVPDEEIGRRIAAAIVLNPGAAMTENDLKRFCSGRLPQYMIPERFSFRDVLPLTSTNKIDRKTIERDLQ
jgi:amino acid adenylation domain-containing protein